MIMKLLPRSKYSIVSMVLASALVISPFGVAMAAETTETTSKTAYAAEIDKSKIMTFEINVKAEDWQYMLDNATKEEYIPADITINGTTIKNVGIRPKGNSSLSAVAKDDTTDRYSFKIKFDEYVKEQEWMGLDKIVLNNNYSDATSMKEYLSYDIMTYIGVDAPLFAYASISVNGENWGFYLAVEDVDSGYLNRTKNGEGELYKPDSEQMDINQATFEGMPEGGFDFKDRKTPEGTFNIQNGIANFPNQSNQAPTEMPAGTDNKRPEFNRDFEGRMGMKGGDKAVALIYTDDEESSYSSIFDNAETKTTSEDYQRIITALKNLNEGTNLETYVDVDAVLRYLAAHTVVVNLDSYSSNMAHNYFLYENNGQLSMIPWDYNMAFGGFQSSKASSVVNFPIDTPVSGVSMEERPLISKLLQVPEYMKKYHQYLQEIIDGYFADGKFEQKIDEINKLISSYVENDPSAFYDYEKYTLAVSELKKLGALRSESIQGQLDGTVPSTNEAQKIDADKLIDASSVDLSLLGDGGKGGMKINITLPSVESDTLKQISEIISESIFQSVELTDAQKTQLKELGLTDQQISELTQMRPIKGENRGFGMPQQKNADQQ